MSQEPQDQVLGTKEIYLYQRAENMRQRQEIEDEGEGEGHKGTCRDICPLRTKDCIWIEKRQTWPEGRWHFIKEK